MQTASLVPVRRSYSFHAFIALISRLTLIAVLLISILATSVSPAQAPNLVQALPSDPSAIPDMATSTLDTTNNADVTQALPMQPAGATCDPDPAKVTSTSDDGSCNTLRSAIAAAASTPTKTVTFGTLPTSYLIISPARGGLTLPAGVSVDGGACSPTALSYNIVGNGVTGPGLTLSGNNTLRNLTIGGFTGKQIFIPTTAHRNELKCTASQASQLTIPPVDPISIAPALDLTVATDFFTQTLFLYTGLNAIQTGVAAGTISRTTVAVLRGKVSTRQSKPLPGATVTILGHPEYGQTLSRADGLFDLVVNGGSILTVNYAKNGYLPAQRTVNVPWRQFQSVPDVVLAPLDPAVTSVNLPTLPGLTVVRGSTISDSNGIRRATLLVSPSTTATMTLPGGGTQAITNLNIRATEYTVGTTGPAAMPATLPASSGYTYATEWSIDQAQAAGALRVDFNQPLIQYLENFLHFSVGQPVPAGYYDRVQGVWVPGKDGKVVKILSITGGLANLDTTGNGVADNGTALNPAVTTAERQQLAALYTAGQTFWRVPLLHFSLWDFNWPFWPGEDAEAPKVSKPKPETPKIDDPAKKCNSIIECQNQIFGEALDVTGTPFSLHYTSDRVPGRKTEYTIQIPLSGASVPTRTKRIDLEISVAGQIIRQSFGTATNQTYTFTWDGRDAYGRLLQGVQKLKTRVGYVYNGIYLTPSDQPSSNYDSLFGHTSFFGVPATADATRREVTLWQDQELTIGAWDNRPLGLAGWSLNMHHVYDPAGHMLYKGDGSRQSAQSLNSDTITNAAGSGGWGFSGDGGPATQATLIYPSSLAFGPDGSFYIADTYNNRVRKVGPDGIITTVAGNGNGGYSGDGGPATQAGLSATGVAVGRDGSLYIADVSNFRVRKVGPNGIITTVAGNGNTGYSGDGVPATQTSVDYPRDVALGPDGSLYITDQGFNPRVRRVGPDGIISTVAGNGIAGTSGDGGPATQANLHNPWGITVGPDGSLYITDFYEARVRKVGPDGIITTIAGNGIAGFGGDGGLATQANLNAPGEVALGADGSLYIADTSNNRVRKVGPDGIIITLAGNGNGPYSGDGGPATQAASFDPTGIAVGPDGGVYFTGIYGVRKVSSAFPGLALGDFYVLSEDGSEAYIFNNAGKHLSTRDTITGATIYQFGYDSAGRLSTITDVDNQLTTINRDTNGNPTAIVGPYGQTTPLTLDANGYLSTFKNPANETYQMGYTADGLLTSFKDPRLNTSIITYDPATGRLIKDQNAANGFFAISRVDSSSVYSVTLTSAEGRSSTYGINNISTGAERRTNIGPDNLTYQSGKGTDGSRTSAAPDGSSSSAILGPDPRFGMQVPLSSSSTITAAPGLVASTATTRSVTLTNPNDPFSLSAMNDSFTINNTRTYTRTYNASTKTFTSKSPENRQSVTVLNNQGRVVSSQFTDLSPIAYNYDTKGRLINTLQGSGPTSRPMTLTYYTTSDTSNGYLQTITDPLTRTISYGYDAAGRIISETLPGTRTLGYGYDKKGNLSGITPPGKPTHTFGYNEVDLPITYTAPLVPGGGTSQTLYHYNLDRQLTDITFPDNALMSLHYDSAGRLNIVTTTRVVTTGYSPSTGQVTAVNVAGGPGLAYSYNGSLLAGETYTGPIAGSVSQTYDPANFWLKTQSVNGANTISFDYDNDGLLKTAGTLSLIRYPQNGLVQSDSLGAIIVAYGYNTFGELTSYTVTQGATTLYSVTYTPDKLGRLVQKVETLGGVTDTYIYTYDDAGRLYQVQKNGVLTATYTYDDNGNRKTGLLGTAGYDDQDRLLTYGPNSYTYNPRGDLLTKTNGSGQTTYTYDVESNLLSAVLPGGTTTISYIVDGQNRRIGKLVNGTLVQGFLYQDGLRPVAELDGTGAIVSRFVYASGSNVPAYLINKDGATYRLITDQVGSVRLVINTATGSIKQRIDYDEYGNVLTDSNPGFQPFGFAGGIYDRDTKLTRFGARDYDAEAGRWTTKDPIRFGGGSANLYSYAQNDPIDFGDKTGTIMNDSARDKGRAVCLAIGLMCGEPNEGNYTSGPSDGQHYVENPAPEKPQLPRQTPENPFPDEPSKNFCPIQQNTEQQTNPPENDKQPQLPKPPFRIPYPLFIFQHQLMDPVIFPSDQV